MELSKPGDLVMLISRDRKRFFMRLTPGEQFQTHKGIHDHDAMIGKPWGAVVESHLGERYVMLQPSLRDWLVHIKRRSQIIFPKDIGYILLRLAVEPGETIMELGTGSGALTSALAWIVGPTGRVISYDRRKDFQDLARENLELLGLEDRVEFRLGDVAEGLGQEPVGAIFVDLPDPEQHIVHIHSSLQSGGIFGAILPTTNQVSDLLLELERFPFEDMDVCEILLRFYKSVPARLRPADRMVAHTGYLVFARSILASVEGD